MTKRLSEKTQLLIRKGKLSQFDDPVEVVMIAKVDRNMSTKGVKEIISDMERHCKDMPKIANNGPHFYREAAFYIRSYPTKALKNYTFEYKGNVTNADDVAAVDTDNEAVS